jgi:hypothetical protein
MRIWLLFWTPFVFDYLFRSDLYINNNPSFLYCTIYDTCSRRRLHTVIRPLRQRLSVLRRKFNAYPSLWKLPSSMYFEFAVRIQYLCQRILQRGSSIVNW